MVELDQIPYADIKVGWGCNNDCIHCVIAGNRRRMEQQGIRIDRTFEEIKIDLNQAKQDGVKVIVLTGGEITIRGDVFDIIEYAKQLGFEIQMQTNGRMFYYKEFTERVSKIAFISYSIAIHGPNAEVHDKITRVKGSFKQTMAGIKRLLATGNCRVNGKIVISKINLAHLVDTIILLHKYGVKNLNVAFPHGQGNASKYFYDVVPKYSEAEQHIYDMIDKTIELGMTMNIESVPYCYMKDRERFSSELIRTERMQLRGVDYQDLDFVKTRRGEMKRKHENCKQCKFDPVCEGVWDDYEEHYGVDELRPMPGEKITDKKAVLNL